MSKQKFSKEVLPRYIIISANGEPDELHAFIGMIASDGYLDGAEYWFGIPKSCLVQEGTRFAYQRALTFVYDIWNSSLDAVDAGILVAEIIQHYNLYGAKIKFELSSSWPELYTRSEAIAKINKWNFPSSHDEFVPGEVAPGEGEDEDEFF